ncbi:MAG: hypothetical protein GY928_14565 [Colwellia sp.]|nr:hypothetical protein [Colwellia sp.]
MEEKSIIAIAVILSALIGIIWILYRRYQSGKSLAKSDPVKLKRGARIVYLKDTIEDQKNAMVILQVKNMVIIRLDDDHRQIKVGRNKCHLRRS